MRVQAALKETSAIKDAANYTWFKWGGQKPLTLTRKDKPYKVKPGAMVGMRLASKGKAGVRRLILMEQGPSIVFTVSELNWKKLEKKMAPVKASKKEQPKGEDKKIVPKDQPASDKPKPKGDEAVPMSRWFNKEDFLYLRALAKATPSLFNGGFSTTVDHSVEDVVKNAKVTRKEALDIASDLCKVIPKALVARGKEVLSQIKEEIKD